MPKLSLYYIFSFDLQFSYDGSKLVTFIEKTQVYKCIGSIQPLSVYQ